MANIPIDKIMGCYGCGATPHVKKEFSQKAKIYKYSIICHECDMGGGEKGELLHAIIDWNVHQIEAKKNYLELLKKSYERAGIDISELSEE